MRRWRSRSRSLVPLLAAALLLAACGGDAGTPPVPATVAPTPARAVATTAPAPSPTAAPPSVPPLPFADNPDPTQCGIPVVWGLDDPAWITGYYQGEVIQPVVYLYDSHARREVVGQIPHGGRVRIVLSQANPALDYYHVRSLDLQPAQSGWVPAPFVLLDAPPPPLPSPSPRGG